MYYPYLRAKKHELLTLLSVHPAVYQKVVPIVEPVNLSGAPMHRRLASDNRPFILITNPQYGDLSTSTIQTKLIEGELRNHASLTLGFLVGQQFDLAALQAFLDENPEFSKAIIFRHNPKPATVIAIADIVQRYPKVEHAIFDENRVFTTTMDAFRWHPRRIRISDGFQRAERNADYETSSAFFSRHFSWNTEGFAGFGDYLIVGDLFQEGGGQGYVVTLHMTVPDGDEVNTYHFSSDSDSDVRGLAAGKFRGACAKLATCPQVLALPSTSGIAQYLDWYSQDHFPNLGPAKQASMQHHIETMYTLLK